MRVIFLVLLAIGVDLACSDVTLKLQSNPFMEVIHTYDNGASAICGTSFKFASYYSDHVVLQRGPQRSWLWGYANLTSIGHNVTVTVISSNTSQISSVVAVERGPFKNTATWKVQLHPVTAVTPHTIQARLDGYKPIALLDVYFGDVWLCSGQSNMQFSIPQMFGHQEEEVEAKYYDKIRLLNVARVTSDMPMYDLEKIIMPWTTATSGVFKGSWEGFSAVCYMYGKHLYEALGYPIGLIDSTWGGTPVESWSDTPALAKCGLDKNTDYIWREPEIDVPDYLISVPTANSVLWNAMIHPLINMTIKGAIWYQGEANTNYHTEYYNCSFPAMIHNWRENFMTATRGQVQSDMPFGFVQIGPNNQPVETFGYPTIRWHQMGDMVSGLPLRNTFMAVAMDLTDTLSPYGAVHIRDKKTVARRLSRAALNIIYGYGSALNNFPYPTKEILDIGAHQLIVQFSKGLAQINVRTNSGFEVCCSGSYSDCPLNSTRNWVPTPIIKYNTTAVWLSLDRCAWNILAAYRYSWRQSPCVYHQCAVYSDLSGDPLPTFTKILNNY